VNLCQTIFLISLILVIFTLKDDTWKQNTITDTHTHLYSEEFDQDRDEMMQRY
jgi:hypothetical protein